MKNIVKVKILCVMFLLAAFLSVSIAAQTVNRGDNFFNKALELEKQASFFKAKKMYESARTEYLKTNEKDKANLCRTNIFKIERIVLDYPYTFEEAKKELKKTFKVIPNADLDKWLKDGTIEHIVIEGKSYYFSSFCTNIFFRHPNLRKYFSESKKSSREFAKKYISYFASNPAYVYELESWNPYMGPVNFLVKSKINVSRKKFPKKGLLRVWVPAPLQTACQRDVKIISISPEKYLKSAPQINEEIGVAYFEIPLEELKDDLNIVMNYSFNHYEQYFKIDPNNVGIYDKETDLYKKYTASAKNIAITPEIKAKALEIIGDEKNSYLQARKIYDYIIDNIYYSYTPHMHLDAMNIPESVFVHNNKYGDCGAQSMYFSALCRSIGIPARSTGGMLVSPGSPSGHFWAEFYLPNYGWVPVDTTVEDALLLSDELTPHQRTAAREYYFGHQDPYRFIIQKDVDVSLYPLPKEQFFSITLQMPRAECPESDIDPNYYVIEGYSTEIMPSY